MLQGGYLYKECVESEVVFYKTGSLKEFNQQLTENISKKIEMLEGELLSLTDLLIADGDLLQEGN